MLTVEQSENQDKYLKPRHKQYENQENPVLVNAEELVNFLCNMDIPTNDEGGTPGFWDILSHVSDVIDLVASLSNPDFKRGTLFSWKGYLQ